LASILALSLRYMPDPIPSGEWRFFARYTVFLTTLRLLIFWRLKLYKVFWRYVGARDLLAVAQGVTLSTVLFFGPLVFSGYPHYPRAVVVMEWLLAILGVGGLRLSLRASSTLHSGLRAERRTMQRLLIV